MVGVGALARPWAGVCPHRSRPAVHFCAPGGCRARAARVGHGCRWAPDPPGGYPQDPGDRPRAGQGLATLCHRSHLRVELYSGATGFFFLYCRIDPYGFERPEDFDYAAYEEFFSTYLVILTRRAIKWSKLLKGSNSIQKSMTGEFGTRSTMHSTNRSLAKKRS